MDNERFIFEDLKVYRRALDLSIQLTKLAIKFSNAYSRIRDQLIGASISVALNLAEGSGRTSDKDKRNFYRMSRGSLFELIPIIDIIHSLGFISDEERRSFRGEITEISKIISTLICSTTS